jgi:spoIIIJ-associated protein
MQHDIEAQIVDFTNQILSAGRFDLAAEVESNEEGFKVQIRGDDVAVLLARNAEMLDAIEYVCNRIFNREPGHDNRIVFDSGNYRARREKELRLMAEKAAEKVRTSHVPFSFDPMSPNERRIIHLALVSDDTVRTESLGDGIDRKVTIYPV